MGEKIKIKDGHVGVKIFRIQPYGRVALARSGIYRLSEKSCFKFLIRFFFQYVKYEYVELSIPYLLKLNAIF